MAAYEPVRTVADLNTLDDSEVLEGYHDGRANEPEPSGNRSRSYWHGWRVGMMDAGRAEIDPAHRQLAKEFLAWQRANR